MRRQVIVQSVGVGVHERLQPIWTLGVLRTKVIGIDEQLHPKVSKDFGLAFSLGEPPHRIQIIRFDAVEVVLGLRIHHTEHRVSIGLPVHVRNAPIVADDEDVLGLLLPAGGRISRLSGRLAARKDAEAAEKRDPGASHLCRLREDTGCDDQSLRFGRALVDLRRPNVAEQSLDNRSAPITGGRQNLHRFVGGFVAGF